MTTSQQDLLDRLMEIGPGLSFEIADPGIEPWLTIRGNDITFEAIYITSKFAVHIPAVLSPTAWQWAPIDVICKWVNK